MRFATVEEITALFARIKDRHDRHAAAFLVSRWPCTECRKEDMTREEAEEFFDYNILGGWHGKATPAYVTFIKDIGR